MTSDRELYSQILHFLKQHYNLEELKTLCFNLGNVNFDDLGGDGRTGKARELIQYLARRDEVDRLLTLLEEERPTVFPKTLSKLDSTPNPFDNVKFLSEGLFKGQKSVLNEPYYPVGEREEKLQDILKENLLNNNRRPIVTVTGIGGIGKTALAVEAMRRCITMKDVPFKAITWSSAKQQFFVEGTITKLKNAIITYEEMVDSLGQQLIGPTFAATLQKEKMLQEYLNEIPTLVIIDNLETIENAQELVNNLSQLLGKSRLLITSRHQLYMDDAGFTLKGLSEASSVRFLRKEADYRNLENLRQFHDNILRHIHQATQGMPLALKLVAGQANQIGVKAALANLKDSESQIYFFVFLQSWSQLSDLAKQILLYLGPSVTAVEKEELEIAFSEEEDGDLNTALKDLVRSSLVNTQFTSRGEPAYDIHQLTRYFVMSDLPEYWRKQGLI